VNDPNGRCSYGFKIQWEQGLRDTIYNKQDWQDHCWMLHKGEFAPVSQADKTKPISLRDFLDRHQYTPQGIRAYEWIFGHGFISPGGEQQNAKFLAQLDLKPGETVLDIGCGIGGNAFQIAKEYGAHVMGVDLSSNMVTMACERASLRKDTRVRFLIADITQFDFEPHTFDVVYSRDCIIHIPDKSALFVKIFKWLKPGGKVLITDYMVGEKEHTPEFKRYLADRQYGLKPLRDYVQAAQSAGFKQVEGQDITDQLGKLIDLELHRATENRREFEQMFPEADYEHLVQGWTNKIGYIGSGDHKWGVIKAVKPPA
jgi:phosphoethanolamine N-methyltransferase